MSTKHHVADHSLLPHSGIERRKYNERLMGEDKNRERSLTNYGHRQNRLGEKNQFNLLPIKSEHDNEK